MLRELSDANIQRFCDAVCFYREAMARYDFVTDQMHALMREEEIEEDVPAMTPQWI